MASATTTCSAWPQVVCLFLQASSFALMFAWSKELIGQLLMNAKNLLMTGLKSHCIGLKSHCILTALARLLHASKPEQASMDHTSMWAGGFCYGTSWAGCPSGATDSGKVSTPFQPLGR